MDDENPLASQGGSDSVLNAADCSFDPFLQPCHAFSLRNAEAHVASAETIPIVAHVTNMIFPKAYLSGRDARPTDMRLGSHIGHIGDRLMVVPGVGMLVQRLRAVLRQRCPAGIPRPSPAYSRWVRDCDTPSKAETCQCRAASETFATRPTVSILMPVFNPEPSILDAAILSIRRQAYPRWELCIADDASFHPGIADVIRRHAAGEKRIKVYFRERRGNISAASHTALEMASGDYVVLFDHDDILPPLALYWVVESINRNPHARILYSDEDRLDARGRRCDPYFKSDFNHVLLLAQNMISHLGVYSRDLVVSVGGFRLGFEGAQDHDLALRCVAAVSPKEIVHIPRILYHWRAIAGSTAVSAAAKPAAAPAALRAVTEHVRRFDPGASVEPAPGTCSYLRIRHSVPTPAPLASIIICTRDHGSLLRTAIESIHAKTTYSNYTIVVLDNGSRDAATLDYLASLSSHPRVTVIRDDSPFNYSRLNNHAVSRASGEMLCLLNDDVEVISPDWLDEMVSFAAQPDIGAVGARLWYPNGTLQHGGVIVGVGGVAGHAHARLPRGNAGYFGRAVLQQELSAVTGACLMLRRDVFEQVGGLDERLAVAFNDVDLCLRIRAAGYRNVWTPFAELIHHESASRGAEDNPEKLARFHGEIRFMHDRWGATLVCDPYYNPNLSMRSGDYTLGSQKHSRALRRAA